MKKVLSVLLVSIIAIVSTGICALAESPRAEILYLNDNIMTSDKDIMENATYNEDVASISNLYEDKVSLKMANFMVWNANNPRV